jgi:ADP-heptose:LPS heptosyltransferase
VPLLASLKAAWPQGQIDWLVQDAFAPAVAAHPALHRVVPFPRRELATWYLPGGGPARLRAFLRTLSEPAYDLVIDAQGLARSALFARATRAPRRVGPADAREFGWVAYTQRVAIDPQLTHTVDRMLALIDALGVPIAKDLRLFAAPADLAWAQREALPGIARYALLAPTSRWPAKRWPAERFAELARALLRRDDLDAVAFVGAASEADQCAPLLDLARTEPRLINLLGRTSVGQLLAVVSQAALVVANDSAALHMAVGFDRPMVALFGPTRREAVGPYGRDADVLQHIQPGDRLDHKHAPSGAALMARIGFDEVARAAAQRLDRVTSSAR